MEGMNERKKIVIQFKKDWQQRGVGGRNWNSSLRYLSESIAEDDGLEHLLVIQNDNELLRMIDTVTTALLYSIDQQDVELTRYLDHIFALFYESYIYRRSLTHPRVLRKLSAVRDGSSLLFNRASIR